MDEFGELNYAIGIAAIFASFASLGLEGVVVQEQLVKPDKSQAIIATSFWLRFGCGFIAAAAAFLTTLLLGDGLRTAALVLIVATGFLPSAFEVTEQFFLKDIRAKVTVKARFFAVLASAGLKLALVAWGAPLVVFAIMQVIEQSFLAFALWVVYRRHGGRLFCCAPSFALARSLLQQSWAIALSGLTVAIYFRSEQIVIRDILGDRGLGLYSASTRVMELWGFVSSAVVTTAFPVLVNMRKFKPEVFRKSVQILYDFLTWAGIAVAILVTIFAPFLIPAVFGPTFVDSIPVLVIHSWTAPVTFAASLRATLMIMENQNHLHLPISLGGIFLYVPSTYFLTSGFGLLGAALSLTANYWITGFASSFGFKALQIEGRSQAMAFSAPLRIKSLINDFKVIWKK